MSRTIEVTSIIPAFWPRDKVLIPELGATGRVLSLYYGDQGLQYRVRYFHSGHAEEVYFFQDELEAAP